MVTHNRRAGIRFFHEISVRSLAPMTRRRAAALAAVILVPVAILAIALGSLIGDDGSGKPAGTPPKPTPGSPRSGPTGPTSPPAGTTSPGSGGAQAPNVRLPVLDKGEA